MKSLNKYLPGIMIFPVFIFLIIIDSPTNSRFVPQVYASGDFGEAACKADVSRSISRQITLEDMRKERELALIATFTGALAAGSAPVTGAVGPVFSIAYGGLSALVIFRRHSSSVAQLWAAEDAGHARCERTAESFRKQLEQASEIASAAERDGSIGGAKGPGTFGVFGYGSGGSGNRGVTGGNFVGN